MKLRSMMCVGAMALATAALADYTDGKVCGWMRIDSTLPVTAVGVPWVDVSNTNNNVKVADLVKTDGLTAGDKLYVYNGGTWSFYTLENNAWVAGNTANASTPSGVTVAGNPAEATIARGQALYLERQYPTNPGYFYVYGAVGGAVPAQNLAANSTYLLASPKAEIFDLNGTGKISAANAADQIIVPLAGGESKVFTYRNSKWGYSETRAVTAADQVSMPWLPLGQTATFRVENGVIDLGTGFWYKTAAGSTPTINW